MRDARPWHQQCVQRCPLKGCPQVAGEVRKQVPRRSLLDYYIYIYYYTPLPLNLANKQATSKQQASNKQATSKQQATSTPPLFWPLLRLIAPGSTLL